MSGLIAIVGRPNVGKSALFNRIVGRRIAIVHDQPGVTRDRVTAEGEWNGRPFTLVDTGGIGLSRGEKSPDVITTAAFDQVQVAIEAANVIILVVNVQESVVPLDREVAQRLRESGKPVLVAVNKVDTAAAEGGTIDFTSLGFEKIFPVTAIHGYGIDALMSAAMSFIPTEQDASPREETTGATAGPLKIAIVGRPNVGKSSIINALTESERVIVSPIPGTTRDAVDVPFEVETEGVRQKYVLIDTAGMRKSRRVDDSVEFFSVKRTEDSIARADITVLVIDAQESITEQDKKIADLIVQNRRACIVVVNKWDLMEATVRKAREEEIQRRVEKKRGEGQEKPMTTLAEFGEWVQERLFFLDYAPVIFTSAKSGFQLERLLEAIRYVAAQLKQKVPTAILNRTLQAAVEKRQPVSAVGHRLKFFYATQVREAPPTFLLFVNRDELLSDQYKKYLGSQLRAAFGYEGCPIILVAKPRPKTVEPIRKFNKGPAAKRPGERREKRPTWKGQEGSQVSNFRSQKGKGAEDRGSRTDDRPRAGVRGPRPDARGPRADVRGPRPTGKGGSSIANFRAQMGKGTEERGPTQGRGPRTEDRRQRSGVRGPRPSRPGGSKATDFTSQHGGKGGPQNQKFKGGYKAGKAVRGEKRGRKGRRGRSGPGVR